MDRSILQLIPGMIIQGLILFLWPLAVPATWFATFTIYQREKSAQENRQLRFSKNRPFFPYGTTISTQNFLFSRAARHQQTVETIMTSIGGQQPGAVVQKLDILDVYPPKPYSKSFVRVSTKTELDTEISFLFNVSTVGESLYLRWWVLVRGRTTFWEVFWYILFAPFLSFAFWIIPWIRNHYSVVAAISGDIEDTYDVFDIEAWVASFQQTAFDVLIHELEKIGVDVTRFKENPPNLNVLNIHGSGNVVGAVAQGASSSASGTVQQAA